MTTPIDRAAKAIWETSSGRQLIPAECEHLARAALATTREPTPEMIKAGAKHVGSYAAGRVWAAMHDAMMEEEHHG